MAERAAEHSMTVDEFIEFEGELGVHYELVNGNVVAMNPPKTDHSAIAGRLARIVDEALDRRPLCRALSECGLRISDHDYFVADLVVACGAFESQSFEDNPGLVIEVLSEDTGGSDRDRKAPIYRDMQSVQEIWLIDSRKRRVEMWRRNEAGWIGHDFIGNAEFRSNFLDCEISLARIYEKTDLT